MDAHWISMRLFRLPDDTLAWAVLIQRLQLFTRGGGGWKCKTDLYKYISQFVHKMYKYISQGVQIHFTIWTSTFKNLDKYLEYGQTQFLQLLRRGGRQWKCKTLPTNESFSHCLQFAFACAQIEVSKKVLMKSKAFDLSFIGHVLAGVTNIIFDNFEDILTQWMKNLVQFVNLG